VSDEVTSGLQAALGDAYAIERELGGGGMSRVFLAREVALDRRVVVKVLPPGLAAGLSTERFRREVLLAARLQHPHIVPLLAAGDAAGTPFFTMPFVEGSSLRERLRDGAPFPLRDAVRLLRDVASALAYAHRCGVVHRDIKPDNVLLSHDSAVVTDFGVAKALSSARDGGGTASAVTSGTLTSIGTSLGTPTYMAPEQAAGDPAADHRVDLYSFGVLAYELLAGAPPFAGRPPHALIVAHLTETPTPLAARRAEVPPALAGLVHRCLAKDPAERPQDATEIVAVLDDVVATTTGDGVARTTPSAGRDGAGGADAGAPGRMPTRGRRTGALLAAGLLVAAGIAGAGVWAARGPGSQDAAASDPTSIAVLPFVNVGGAAQDEYFSDGMTDELTGALGDVPGLRVASRTSAFAFKGRNVDAREIGRALHVGSLLEGRVRRDGQRLRVSAQLTSATDGLALWSETYEREMRDVFRVQDEIAGAIAAALRVRLTAAADTAAGSRARTADMVAYDLYLRGRYHLHRRGGAELQRAAGYFEQATRRDPGYAAAHAGLADAMALLPVYGDTPADSAFAVARAAAERAVALDGTLAEAHTTLGLVHKSLGEWEAAERALRRAVALDAGHAPAHQWLGEVLIITGRVPEAAVAIQEAARLDPMSAVIHAELAYTLGLLGRAEEAFAAGRRGIELAPELWTAHAFLGYAYLFNDRLSDALREIEAAVALDSTVTPVLGTLAFAYGAAGRADRARALAMRLDALAERPNGSAIAASLAWLGAGDPERGLAWLERAAERRDSWLYAMSVNAPFFDAVRDDPRFAAVVRRMELDVGRMTSGTGR
jgi:serine/threonine-protein kinase